MAGGVVELPPEMLARIFTSLSQNRDDIASARLVCRKFRDCASPYLITRVVVAQRLEPLKKLQEVLEHPYFHKHVTELLVDCSRFDHEAAGDLFSYRFRCRGSPCSFDALDWESRIKNDVSLLTEITSFAEGPDSTPFRCDLDNDIEHLRPALLRGWDPQSYENFCHYGRLNAIQDNIEFLELPSLILAKALSGFPSLKYITFADWRILAKPGEDYSTCSKRLFGNILAPEPHILHCNTLMLDALLQALEKSPSARIESLTTGPHSFGVLDGGKRYGDGLCHTKASVHAMVRLATLQDYFDQFGGPRLMKDLKRLRLDICVGWTGDGDVPGVRPDVSKWCDTMNAATNLTHLALRLLDESPEYAIHLRPPYAHFYDYRGSEDTYLENDFFARSNFPHLRSLYLRNWTLPRNFKDFLGRHAGTLQIVSLSNCHTDSDGRYIAQWAGDHLSLHGVDLDTPWALDDREGHHEPGPAFADHVSVLEILWLAGRPNFLHLEDPVWS